MTLLWKAQALKSQPQPSTCSCLWLSAQFLGSGRAERAGTQGLAQEEPQLLGVARGPIGLQVPHMLALHPALGASSRHVLCIPH